MANPLVSNARTKAGGDYGCDDAASGSDAPGPSLEDDSPFQFRLAATQEEMEQCKSLRHAIFVQEQGVPAEAEYDGKDDQAFHIVCYKINFKKEHDTTVGGGRPPAEESSSPALSIVATGRVLVVPVGGTDSSSSGSSSSNNNSSSGHNSPSSADESQRNKEELRAVLGRIAVRSDHRGQGLGRKVVRALERVALTQGAVHASLTPHHYLERFYTSLGYHPSPVQEGCNRLIHVNEYCQLIAMEKRLLP